jgi:excisionase family DNA binding protein
MATDVAHAPVDRAPWYSLLADALEVEAAAQRLGLPAATVERMVYRGELVAVRVGGRWRLPSWQFSADGLISGMPNVMRQWPGSFVSLWIWACAPSELLDGRTPAEALTGGDVDAVATVLSHALGALTRGKLQSGR